MNLNIFFRPALVSLGLLFGMAPAMALLHPQPPPQEMTVDEATQLVIKSLESAEILSAKSYCTKGTMTCRTMYRLKDKLTGQPSRIYYDTFFSADRQVGSTCYFIPSQEDPTQYYVLTDSVFDGQKKINIISPQFATIHATPDYENIVFGNIKSPKLGTTQYTLGAFYQTEESVILEGITYDNADPNFKQNVHIEYLRINP